MFFFNIYHIKTLNDSLLSKINSHILHIVQVNKQKSEFSHLLLSQFSIYHTFSSHNPPTLHSLASFLAFQKLTLHEQVMGISKIIVNCLSFILSFETESSSVLGYLPS